MSHRLRATCSGRGNSPVHPVQEPLKQPTSSVYGVLDWRLYGADGATRGALAHGGSLDRGPEQALRPAEAPRGLRQRRARRSRTEVRDSGLAVNRVLRTETLAAQPLVRPCDGGLARGHASVLD